MPPLQPLLHDEPPLGSSLIQLWAQAVDAYGAEVAVRGLAANWTWRELDEASDRVAARLLAQGIQRGDRVAIYAINGPEFAIVYLGIMKVGAVVVPVNVLIKPGEIAFILNDAGARGVFYSGLLGPNLA
ncbi:MAG: AMP-binding protein, partial [Gammaproteobacteria bacterium]